MARSKPQEVPLPKKLDDLVEFFEAHDMGAYWARMPEAHFDIEIIEISKDGLARADEKVDGRPTLNVTRSKGSKTIPRKGLLCLI